ncbi:MULTISPECIES: chemotaxis protein CheW [Pseudoalteromonas]|uniref:Chemotaxis protein CheW n=2 Tax=Pseudoalteromonas TaxID=53246 RepID=A0A0F4Q2N4_9GAMM|nr:MULTISPECIES: chemotaxis protein CheW [Pseudoalteromonas]KJY97593.1 chemotaxis protein CheW [Pseudoalteromonas ruthenica]KJZ01620.1 chemotaxis protein CheW [Pseudoalteromonas ruthenica]MCF2862504.1 chemotaxis protein CheW [Pseudoalteromonas sp. CNAT2-18]MCG7544720.1 chemotaxis protein CheW [Pseudoalteromonas sp. MM17-2]MCG7559044.1 chemotaxis protein CheW [Pseudoalteromonas sp. CNAT2-18.1]|tara:strand:- start:2296 stop:2778 length:483 start_codon:yes stop_codon:yes gene_type:complete
MKVEGINEHIILQNNQGHIQQYLTFMMADEEYGMDILSVQEIRGWEEITAIPNAPDYIKGVINLRGTIVPIIDLRLRFGIEPQPYGPLTVVIVVKEQVREKTKVMGLVVDAVSDVYAINQQDAKGIPEFNDSSDNELVERLVNVGETMVILLDLPKILDC